MSVLRIPVLLALLVLLLTAGFCKQSFLDGSPGVSKGARTDGHNLMELIMDKVRLAQQQDQVHEHYPAKKQEFTLETKERNEVNKSHHGEHIIEVFPRDLRQKEKFLKHLTGPLFFNPRCRKHFYRLYHNTRDCTIPAYYKRCARLLTRLAGSQRCTER
ncbi:ALK and LTK ligand 2 [Salmo salar]|uniref:ALK and LTK ligand 2b n=2 Tax=Salmo TaxID=8028 RepID=A0A673ZYV2_SALTR|nr:ALK and LTK ligand 2-like [Salmo trutta]XP_045579659.1 ALK and LTK ligand 2 [Salmo salar]|eukprot:XP_014038900.1 PREDICTED: protein FAM150B-like [Salmo salar]